MIQLANHAKNSKMLDITADVDTLYFVDKIHNKKSWIVPCLIEKFAKGHDNNQITVITRVGSSESANALDKLGFEAGNNWSYSTPLDKFIDIITNLFNNKEAEIVDQIKVKKLIEELNSLVTKAE